MPTWEETKRSAQNVYNMAGQGFDLFYRKSGLQSIYNDLGSSFQQFLIAGHVYPPMERNYYNYEIAQNQNQDQNMGIKPPEANKDLETER